MQAAPETTPPIASNQAPIAGATFADVELMKKHIGENVKVKAAGGISSFDDAEKFILLGADRLGTSRLVKIMKNTDVGVGY